MTIPHLTNWLWAAAYVAAMVGLVVAMRHFRQRAVSELTTPAAQADWERFRADAEAASGTEGPVQRRVPKSPEPPALVLLRDHYPVMLGAALVFGTALFGMIVFAVKGSLWREGKPMTTNGQRADEDTV